MSDVNLAALRVRFPDHQISQLPRGGTTLSYVGHAATTNRLLDCDPGWSWEPVAFGTDGLPAFDADGGLWIRLTVCGVTRLGYGNAANKTQMDVGARVKECIGDAIRNAAMRAGVALDLWAKEPLTHDDEVEPDGYEAFLATFLPLCKAGDREAALAVYHDATDAQRKFLTGADKAVYDDAKAALALATA